MVSKQELTDMSAQINGQGDLTDIQRELKDSLLAESSDAIMVLVHLYVRFRHGYIGSQDQEAITRAEKLLSEYYARDVSAMTNDELVQYFKV